MLYSTSGERKVKKLSKSMKFVQKYITNRSVFVSRMFCTLRDSINDLDLKAVTQNERKETEIAFCCVCLEGEKTILVMPCKHLCLCEPCPKQKKLKLCPVCRTKIQQKINVFV